MSIPSIPEIYSIYFHPSDFLFLTLWHFKTKEMWFVAAVYTLLTCCMLLGWCGPVGGQHVAPACVCVCEIPETYLDTLRNASRSEAINCRLTGQQKHRQRKRDGEKQLFHCFLCWFRTIFLSLWCWHRRTTACFTEFDRRVVTDQWESGSQTCLSADGWVAQGLERRICVSSNPAEELQFKLWKPGFNFSCWLLLNPQWQQDGDFMFHQ